MASCKHPDTRKVVQGAPARWCSHCGSVYDGERWHRHKGHAHAHKAAHKAAPAHKAAKKRGKAKRARK